MKLAWSRALAQRLGLHRKTNVRLPWLSVELIPCPVGVAKKATSTSSATAIAATLAALRRPSKPTAAPRSISETFPTPVTPRNAPAAANSSPAASPPVAGTFSPAYSPSLMLLYHRRREPTPCRRHTHCSTPCRRPAQCQWHCGEQGPCLRGAAFAVDVARLQEPVSGGTRASLVLLNLCNTSSRQISPHAFAPWSAGVSARPRTRSWTTS